MNWKCPHCNHASTLSSQNIRENKCYLDIEENNKDLNLQATVIWKLCPNVDCQKASLFVETHNYETVKEPYHSFTRSNYQEYNYVNKSTGLINSWQLIPKIKANTIPEYIPIAIKQDYEEAYLVLPISPKASATLSRRCLQGMIRDFFKISKNSLADEIKAIEDKIEPIVKKTLDAVRQIGNIGAHMEKDVNLIVEIKDNEAEVLLNLIETLFKEWYINRHEREEMFNKIVMINETKQSERKGEI